MPSSYTDLGFELQAAGENVNTWGDTRLNYVITRINYAFGGFLSIAITGDYTLPSSNSVSPTALNLPLMAAQIAQLKFTGTLSANATITLPSVAMRRTIWNATNKALTFTTGAGTTVVIDSGDRTVIDCDGMAVQTISFGGLGLKDFIAASVLAATGSLPATTGNEGKSLFVRSGVWTPAQVQSTDIGDFDAEVRRRTLVYSLIFGGA